MMPPSSIRVAALDVTISDVGSLFLFSPISIAAQEWIAAHVGGEALWWGSALVVEPRYARDLSLDMMADGLRVGTAEGE